MNKQAEKERLYTSTPMSSTTGARTFYENDKTSVPRENAKTKPTTLSMVIEAVENVGVKRKGASYQAIKKYINGTQDPEHPRTNVHLKRAIMKGIENGLLERPHVSKNAIGVTGHFIVAKSKVGKPKGNAKDIKNKPTKVRKEQVSDTEAVIKKPSKPKNLNLSDSAIQNLETKPKEKLAIKPKPAVKPKPAIKPKPKPEKPNKKSEEAKPKEKEMAAKKPKVVKADKEKPIKVKAGKTAAKNRKDVSDSEMVVKKPNRKSLKSYSSDTEVMDKTVGYETKAKKRDAPKGTGVKAATIKNKAMKEKSPIKAPKGKKLYNKATEEIQIESKDATTLRANRTRIKKK